MMPYAVSISLLQYAALVLGGLLFGAAVFAKRLRTPKSDTPAAALSRLSIVGIAIQTLGFFIASIGRVHVDTPAFSARSIVLSAIVLALGVAGALLFDRSAKVLGANWSLVARMRSDHGLVRDGPFAHVRHPIYLAMLLLLVAVGLGLGHLVGLLAGIPFFVIGTAIRIREEERLLRMQFGAAHELYARETPAFIPKIF